MRRIFLAGAAAALISGCDRGVGLNEAQAQQCAAVVGERICTTGTVHYSNLEGGFWAIRGDDNVTYDPLGGGLPEDFQVSGLRVYMVAKERKDMASFHMAGPIVEIISIEKLPRQ